MYSSSSLYGASTHASSAGGSVSIAAIISVLAVLAVIFLSVFCYKKFLGKACDRASFLGKFFHFDHFYVEQITRVLYLVTAIACPVSCIWFLLICLNDGVSVLTFIGLLILWVVVIAVLEFLIRLMFEESLIKIRQAVDIRAIRWKVVGDVPAANDGEGDFDEFADMLKNSKFAKARAGRGGEGQFQYAAQPAQQAAAAQPAQQAAAAAQAQPAQPAAQAQAQQPAQPSQPAKWVCPNCGASSAGNFCGQCGTKKN